MPRPHNFSDRPASPEGFALVIALALMAFVMLLVMSLAVFSQVETRSAATAAQQHAARLNAELALQIALADLQKTLGPDRRVSARAEILEDSIAPDPGRSKLVGVWSNLDWDHQSPRAEREFTGWLISQLSPDGSGHAMPTELAFVEEAPSASTVSLSGENSVGPQPDEHIRADLIPIQDTARQSRYAFWIEDEGLKARANLPMPSDEFPAQGSLAWQRIFQSAPRNGIEQLVGLAVEGLSKILTFDQLLLATDAAPSPLPEGSFFDLGFDSLGLQTDTARGGLMQDLNTLFELEDAVYFASEYGAEAPDSLRASELEEYAIAPVDHRLMYSFQDIPHGSSFETHLHGPSWALLRDHYRQYKGISVNSSGRATASAREVLPRPLQLRDDLAYTASFGHDDPPWFHAPLDNLEKAPVRSSKLAPALLRLQYVVSLLATEYTGPPARIGSPQGPEATHELNLIFSPVFVIWNPYDVELNFQGISFYHTNTLPMSFDFEVETAGFGVETATNQSLNLMTDVGNDPSHHGSVFAYATPEGITLAPGETRVLSLAESTFLSFEGRNKEIDLAPFESDQGGLLLTRLQPEHDDRERDDRPTKIFYYEPGADPGSAPTIESDKILLNETESGIAVTQHTRFRRGINIWLSHYFVLVALIHEGHYDERFRVKTANPGSDVSTLFVSGVNTVFENTDRTNMHESIGSFGRSPENSGGTAGFYNTGAQLLDRLPIGTLNTFVRAADGEGKPTKILGVHSPVPHVASSPLFGNEFNDETMIPPFRLEAAKTDQLTLLEFDFSTKRAFWGDSSSSSGSHFAVTHHVPRLPLWSVASLQHALTAFHAYQPSHAIGNSFASPWVPKDRFWDVLLFPRNNNWEMRQITEDQSYLTNHAIWDSHFFSSLAPETGVLFDSRERTIGDIIDQAGERGLPNPRMRLLSSAAELRDAVVDPSGDLKADAYRAVAEHVAIEGAFNVNSTSVQAWESLLSGLREQAFQYFPVPEAGGTSSWQESERTVYPRSLTPHGGEDELWTGFRSLTDAQLRELAENIVEQVKTRGPFMSLSHFVNRELSLEPEATSGALQSAIDEADINAGSNYQVTTVLPETVDDFPNPEAAAGATTVGASAYLTQADLLQPMAPFLRPRSDTFRIRVYGEAASGIGGAREPARAWGEAIVQRMPQYVDPANEATDDPGTLTPLNQTLGRRFEIVSFRWLGPEEI